DDEPDSRAAAGCALALRARARSRRDADERAVVFVEADDRWQVARMDRPAALPGLGPGGRDAGGGARVDAGGGGPLFRARPADPGNLRDVSRRSVARPGAGVRAGIAHPAAGAVGDAVQFHLLVAEADRADRADEPRAAAGVRPGSRGGPSLVSRAV